MIKIYLFVAPCFLVFGPLLFSFPPICFALLVLRSLVYLSSGHPMPHPFLHVYHAYERIHRMECVQWNTQNSIRIIKSAR